MEKRDCYNCVFWKGDENDTSELGECHRHAPPPHLLIVPRSEGGELADVYSPVIETVWPKTGYWDFCGDFQQNKERRCWE